MEKIETLMLRPIFIFIDSGTRTEQFACHFRDLFGRCQYVNLASLSRGYLQFFPNTGKN